MFWWISGDFLASFLAIFKPFGDARSSYVLESLQFCLEFEKSEDAEIVFSLRFYRACKSTLIDC